MKSIDVAELKELEFKLLEILDMFCKKKHLRYYLTYGTLIGAVRHKGFIPWDDDIDVIMPRKDYEILIKSFNEESDNDYARIVSHKIDRNYYLPIAKLVDNDTVLKEKLDVESEIGVYIDIFPLENLSDDYETAKKRMKKGFSFCEKWMIKTISLDPTRNKIKNIILKIGKQLLHNESVYSILDDLDKYCCETMEDDFTKYVGVMCGISARDESRVFKREWFDKTIQLEFEGKFFPAPIGYDSLLRLLYDDYMQLPPEDKQVSHHVFEAWYKE